MSLAELYTLLNSITGFADKVAYRQFEEDAAPALPFIVYYEESTDNFKADNKVYQKRRNIVVELYTQEKDPNSEELVEKLLDDNSIPWDKIEEYIDSEHMYMNSYSILI